MSLILELAGTPNEQARVLIEALEEELSGLSR